MNPIRYTLKELKEKTVPIGREGENEYTVVSIDCAEVYEEHPAAVASMKVQNPNKVIYPVVIERSGNDIIWTVKASDLTVKGDGRFQLTFTEGTVIHKTVIGRTLILKSLVGDGPVPEAVEDWLDEAEDALEDLVSAEVHQPIIGEDGFWYKWNQEDGEYQKTDTKAKGEDGQDGHTPEKGVDYWTAADKSEMESDVAGAIIDDTSTALDKTWSASKSNTLLSDIQEKPETKSTDAQDVDLDIVDQNGYVLIRMVDGHIQTKKFNSSEIPGISFSDAENVNLDVTDDEGYVIVRLKDGHIKTKNFDSSKVSEEIEKVGGNPVEYKIVNGVLYLAYKYNATSDAVVIMNEGRANDLFEFAYLKTKPISISLADAQDSDLTTVWSSGTDMHGPFEFLAVNNPDGAYSASTDPGWTGGIHLVTIDGENVKTAETLYVHFFADGSPVESGNGRCSHFEIRWANGVQAYNCVKADGTGRTSLIEYHDMIFDGVKFDETVRIMPTEDIKMQLWYGFQMVAFGTSAYPNLLFRDATNRQIFTMEDDDIESGNSLTSGICGYGTDHAFEVLKDTTVDLGKNDFYIGTSGAFAVKSTGKSYFNTIRKMGSGSQALFSANTSYFLKGSYRFYPSVQ